jgi:hypothetical protein
MWNKVCLIVASFTSLGLSAAVTPSSYASSASSQLQPVAELQAPNCDCYRQPGRYPCQRPYLEEWLDENGIDEQAEVQQVATPIYIGGVRYSVAKSAMTPVYRERYLPPRPCLDEEPRLVRTFVGYKISIPVDGDYGQSLFFDISGRATTEMGLKVSCGSFAATDNGNKFIISQQQVTNYSCRSMDIELTTSNASADVNLVISIAEEL